MNGFGRGDKKKNESKSSVVTRETAGMTLLLFSALLLLITITRSLMLGEVGVAITAFFLGLTGYLTYPVLALCIYFSIILVSGKKLIPAKWIGLSAALLCAVFCIVHLATSARFLGEGYGAYLGGVWNSGAEGVVTATGGGVLFGLFVYPVQLLLSPVGAYVVFSLLIVVALFFLLRATPLKALWKGRFSPRKQQPSRAYPAPISFEELSAARARGGSEPAPYGEPAAYGERAPYGGSAPYGGQASYAERTPYGERRYYDEPARPRDDSAFQTESAASNSPSGRGIAGDGRSIFDYDPAESYRRNLIFSKESRFNTQAPRSTVHRPTEVISPAQSGAPSAGSTQSAPTAQSPFSAESYASSYAREAEAVRPAMPRKVQEEKPAAEGGYTYPARGVLDDFDYPQRPSYKAPATPETPSRDYYAKDVPYAAPKIPETPASAPVSPAPAPTVAPQPPAPAPAPERESRVGFGDTPRYEEPARSYEEPTRGYEEPKRSYEEPTRSYDEPARSYEEPARDYEEPARGYEEPARGADEPARGAEERGRYEDSREEDSRTFDRDRGEDSRTFDRDRGEDSRTFDRDREDDSRAFDRDRGERGERDRSDAELFDSDEEFLDDPNEGYMRGGSTGREDERASNEDSRASQMLNALPARETAPAPAPAPAPVPQRHVYKEYVAPPLTLFTEYSEEDTVSQEEIQHNSETIVATLSGFGVEAVIVRVTCGSSVTRYDLDIPRNVSATAVTRRASDLGMRLRVREGVNVYINSENGAISVEVPNKKRATVGMRSVLESEEFQRNKPGSLIFSLGKDVEGRVLCGDIVSMTHVLIAGSTGSGKSVLLHTILASLITKYSPAELRLILIDPKKTEFIVYEGLPHLMINEIISDAQKVVTALKWAEKEMERRYDMFRDMSRSGVTVRGIDEYNAKLSPEEEKLPKIVIVVDELADLMLLAKKDLEDRISRLTAKARAAGIHLIIATQRPSVDVITGVIKSNLPTRIGLHVAQEVDSRIILDESGAERLLGHGDMLYSVSGSKKVRAQGCFISSDETASVVDFIKKNNEAFFDNNVSDYINHPDEGASTSEGGDGFGDGAVDQEYIRALGIVVKLGSASISLIQRKCSVGYNHAGKIIEWMELMGYITPFDGKAKARAVLLTKEEYESKYGSLD